MTKILTKNLTTSSQQGGSPMSQKFYLNFPVFFHCVVKKHSSLKTNKEKVSYLLSGYAPTHTNGLNDDDCSRYSSGTRTIPNELLKNIRANSDSLSTRFDNLGLKNIDCLKGLRYLVRNNQLIVDEEIAESLSKPPASKTELQQILGSLFISSLDCDDILQKPLTSEDKKFLQNSATFERNLYALDNDELYENEFIQNYKKTLFWSDSEVNTLQNLYVFNSYVTNTGTTYNNLADLIANFLSGDFDSFLRKTMNSFSTDKIQVLLITSLPGCGKTSLISKLAFEHSNNKKTFFINMANMINMDINLDAIADKLCLDSEQLKDSVLILDSLDEAIKHAENTDEILQDLCEQFEENNITSIITCRSNLVHSEGIRCCFEITLNGFDTEKAKEWLNNYYKYNPNFKLDKWKATIDKLSPSITKVLLIPLMLYICVIREIDIENIKDLMQLYDILFDTVRGQIATTTHRKRVNMNSKDWKILRMQVSDIAITMFQKGYIDQNDVQTSSLTGLQKYFGLDFYVVTSSTQIRFVHASIWQYFLAERLYKTLTSLQTIDDTQSFIDQLARIVVPEKTIDNTSLSFVEHFAKRDHWTPANPEVYKYVLLHISQYSIVHDGNNLDWISCVLRESFKLFTTVFDCYHKKLLETLFQELSTDENRDLLINCSNLTNVSPLIYTSKYVLNNLTLNRINFAYSYMKGCRLRSGCFRNANFDFANMSGSYADHGDFSGSSFRNANLGAVTFQGSTMICCDFSNARMKGADLSYADISYSDLRTATLNRRTKFDYAKLNHCKINVAQLEYFNTELVKANNIHVYDDKNKELSYDDLIKYYYEEKHPSFGAFRKCSRTVREAGNIQRLIALRNELSESNKQLVNMLYDGNISKDEFNDLIKIQDQLKQMSIDLNRWITNNNSHIIE